MKVPYKARTKVHPPLGVEIYHFGEIFTFEN